MTDPKKDKQEADKTWVTQLLTQAQARRYYGALTIVMEGGDVKRVDKVEKLIPPA